MAIMAYTLALAALIVVAVRYGIPFFEVFVIGMFDGQLGSGKDD